MNKSGVWSSKRRKSKEIPIGRNVLFICCGACTEPNYFNHYLKIIKEKMEKKAFGITRFNYKIESTPVTPAQMAELAHQIAMNKNEEYSEVYVVFDKDDFPNDNFDNAIKSINDYSNSDCLFVPLWSNQCIELWFLIHFEYMHSQLERKQYFSKLADYMNSKYEKNMSNIATLLEKSKGSLEIAIKNAKKLKEDCSEISSFSKKNPCTNIDAFFEEYLDYIK